MNDYTINRQQVIELLRELSIPPNFTIRGSDHVVDVPQFISINLSRMYCGSKALEHSAKMNMMAMSAKISLINNETTE